MLFGYSGTMRTQPGHRDEVVALLLEGVGELRPAGCHVYAVSVSDDDPDLIWVHEVWDSKQAHHASLQLPSVRETISRAMPMLTGEFTGQETTVVGGLGVPRG
jgi:quinol monooxygenase YgiN